MADKFRALLVTKDGNRQSVAVTELTPLTPDLENVFLELTGHQMRQ